LGGGARGRAWQETVRRLSGRPVLVVEQVELVAYGAAVQAGALLAGSGLPDLVRAWDARRGLMLEPQARDEPTLAEIARWRRHVLVSLGAATPPATP
jgi:xylulokinase